MMKVLFLDIDGVLNCTRTPNPRKFPYVVDEELLGRFRGLVNETGVKVVMSSTWRYDPAGLFSARNAGIPFDDVLPDMPGRPRRDEVLSWLAAHQDVTRYAVLDDDDDALDQLPLFQPSPRYGLSKEICDALRSYFAGETDKDMRRTKLFRLMQNVRAILKGHEG
jgi:hypothetical protein